MPALGPLGVGRAVVLLLALVVFPIVGFLVRRRWRRSAARRAEVMLLTRLAAQEAAWAEEEAAMVARGVNFVPAAAAQPTDGGGSVLPEFQQLCAVCLVPATAHCARCKAVRYCTRNCQIIHWRQGHKNVCHPPQIHDCDDGKASISRLHKLSTEESDLSFANMDVNSEPQKETIITYSKSPSYNSSQMSEAFSDNESVNTSGTDSSTDSSDSSFSCCSTSSGSVGTMDSFALGDHHNSPRSIKIEEHSSDLTLNDELYTSVRDSKVGFKESAFSQIDSMTLSKSKACCTISCEHKESFAETKDIELNYSNCLSSETMHYGKFSNDNASEHSQTQSAKSAETGVNLNQDDMIADSADAYLSKRDSYYHSIPPSHIGSSKLPDQANSAQIILKNDKFSSGHSISRGKIQSYDTTSSLTGKSSGPSEGQEFQPKVISSPASASVDQVSASGGCFISNDASTKVGPTLKVPQKSYQSTGSDSNGVKQSVHRVVRQLKLSKLSKPHASGLGNYSSAKFKMLFPYDNFVKLYNFDKMELRPSGLTNCGNSCYANAVLQCLAFTPPLTAYLLQRLHSRSCRNTDWCFTCELEDMLLKVKQGHSPILPTGVLSHLHKIGSHLGHGREEDAHEFLRYAIDVMQSVCLNEAGGCRGDYWAEETTLIKLTFGGYLRSKIQCTKCHSISERNERMMDLTVEIQGDIATLDEALRRFTSTEILDGDNKYHCSRCQSYVRAKKKLTVLDAPNILTIALKRFQSGKFGKLNKAIRFPEHLDLAPYMSGSLDKYPLYRLYAVVVHLDVMNAAFSGHYICYVRSTQGKWYKTDDSLVKPVELRNVLSKNAYMLFYARCLPHSPGLTRGITFQDQVIGRWSKNQHSLGSDSERMAVLNAATLKTDTSAAADQHSSGNGFSFSSDERFVLRRTDSASDSSSLFGCLDDASCSSDSTRNSTSTDELSDFIFGDLCRYS